MKDRIQVSSVCLYVCAIIYAITAWSMYQREGSAHIVGAGLGIYAVAVYGALGVLAIDLKRWAWKFTNLVFCIHVLLPLVVLARGAIAGPKEIVFFLGWIALGGLGLWANLRPASRSVLVN